MDASRAEGCSSSSKPIPPQWVYDVFVSFRGADTRKNFTSHLFAGLEDNGIRTFRDDKELERGEFISDGLLKAIEGSRMSLIVFSKDYAGSRWCLDELVRIMVCRETLKQIVVPIFYDVVPSDVRKQTGDLQEAFAKHEKCFREGSDGKVEKWRAALTEAANLSGRHLLNEANGDEAELIKMIIKDVREKVNPIHLNVPDRQVGLDCRVAKLNVLLNMEFNFVRIVGIWGMGGIGKTTIAKRLYNIIQHKFERSGFLADVRETSQRPNGLVELQKKLILAILKRSCEVSNSHEGVEVIKKIAFGRKKVLLILDDVDNVQQLKALAIDRDSFAPGSRIIITTRDKYLLKILELGEKEIYGPEKLDEDESLELFSWHAFKEDHPLEDYLDLSRQIVHYAGGLPLALEVLGSYFRGESIPQWERAIAKLRKVPADDVLGKLKISYESLSEQLKKLFLDTACFFVGIGRDFTIKILEGRYDIFVDDEIRKLADRCLIKYDRHDQIVMHDMIRDMGREIVRQESLDLGKRSRLWYRDDILKVLRDGTGTEAVKGLILNATDVQVNANPFEKMDKLWYRELVLEVRRVGMGTEVVEGRLLNFNDPKDVLVNAKAFEKMNNLWLLHLDYVHLTTGYEHISRRLLWLSWKGFPLNCIPWNFSMEMLVALDLRYSSLKQVWNRNMILDKLKFLYLSHCHYLTRTPDFSGLYSLEELLLNDCKSLEKVDKSIRYLNKLVVLDMKNCTKLRKLPSGILMLKSLKRLDLSGCSNLGNSAVFVGPLNKLWCSFFSSWTLPPKCVDSIGFSLIPVQPTSCLMELNLKDCHLSYLPDEIGNLIALRTLNLAGNNLSTLPDTIVKLSCLKDLLVENNKLSHLPSEIGDLDSLETLRLGGNKGFRALPESICELVRLRVLSLYGCNLSHLPSEIGGLTSLEYLYISGNNICTIPDSISSLHRLDAFFLNNCAKLRSLPKLSTCTSVSAEHCPSLERLPLELDQLGRRVCYSESNKLAENSYLTSLLKQLPRSKGLSELQHAVDILVPVAGDEEVRIWFPYQDGRGPNVSFVVPPSPSPSVNQKMVGWILRLLVWHPGGLHIRDVIFNKIEKRGLFNLVVFHRTEVDLVWLLYIPQGYARLRLKGGDEVEIPIIAYDNAVVKNWAIDVIYAADDELHKGNNTLYQVVGPI
ncbi:disease resistance protein RPV1-like isoform X4 [Rhododendron vialii]|uniref:disease resistance protein RPV1-like isoform X4 n=1 Tax=Rhododendron vialii TaxID=182163 RepID=UPI00265EB698|nr:disease resistance protein RPV1-like isoform X4 [Rhododendron vialii]XP_058184975.1 disease resistance protein RPV1-like isoform X4 [Rhododendron vialii]XP_058184985.1 disease resistance protein RPV1-like isoform X4 [Rhododendron vialii]